MNDGSSGSEVDAAIWRAARSLFCDLREAEPEHRARIIRDADLPPEVVDAAARLLRAHEASAGFLEGDESAEGRPARAVPKRVGPYLLEELLGEGGFGVVYRARQLSPIDRDVAIKLIRPGFDTPRMLARFTAERDYLSRVDHPGVAKVLDAGVSEDGQMYVAIELVRGETITDYARLSGLTGRQKAELMARVGRAVHAVHQRMIIHRDLKPSNILVSTEGGVERPRVIDFGIATAAVASERSGLTFEGTPIGSRAYSSPEQLRGEGVDIRADIYSLGVVLGELLSGEPPDPNGYPGFKLLNRAGPDADLARIVRKATAGSPEHRYDSAASLADDLDRFLAGMPVSAVPASRVYVARKFLGRHGGVAALVFAALVLVNVAAGVAILQRAEAFRQRDAARTAADRTASVGRFLLDSIARGVDPDLVGERPAIDPAALAGIADRAVEADDDNPEIMLTLLDRIGGLQTKLGDVDGGLRTHRAAFELASAYYGVPHERSFEARLRLFDQLNDHALPGSGVHLDALEAESNALFSPDDARMLSLRQRGDITTDELGNIVDRYETLEGVSYEDRSRAIERLAVKYITSGQRSDATDMLHRKRLLDIERFGEESVRAAISTAAYANSLSTHAPLDEPLRLLLIARERLVRRLGTDHSQTAFANRYIAGIVVRLDRPAEAIGYAKDALRHLERAETGLASHANAVRTLGLALHGAGRTEEAVAALRDAIRLNEANWPRGHHRTASVRIDLAAALLALGRAHEAREVLTSAIPDLTAAQHADAHARGLDLLAAAEELLGSDVLDVPRVPSGGSTEPPPSR